MKHVKLEEETRILLNQAKSLILKQDPTIRGISDDKTINTSLKKFIGGTLKK